jgi:hypothetical protein
VVGDLCTKFSIFIGATETKRVGLYWSSETDRPRPEPREDIHKVGHEGSRTIVQRSPGSPEEYQNAAQPGTIVL